MKKVVIIIVLLMLSVPAEAQFLKKLGKKAKEAAERGVERTVERKTEKKASEKTDDAIEGVLGGKKKKKEDPKSPSVIGGSPSGKNPSQEIVTGSTFFPNGQVLYSENFSKDAQGDFPAGWETDSGGEIISLGGQKALRLYPNGVYLAGNKTLPENYAIEFDLTTQNLAYQGTAGSAFDVIFSNKKELKNKPVNGAKFRLPLWYKSNQYVQVQSWGKNSSNIKNDIDFALDSKLNTTTHYTLVVNGNRLRVYLDDRKAADLPTFLKGNLCKEFSLYLWGTNINKYNHIVAVSNLKITKEGQDLRSQIMKGGFSTTEILFASGSDNIQSSSYIFLDDLANTLNSDTSLNVKIIGHTDSDGDENSNLNLSKKRAESVKNYLVSKGISASRLQTDGKGESEPVASNSTSDGKAQNRRVEFKKI